MFKLKRDSFLALIMLTYACLFSASSSLASSPKGEKCVASMAEIGTVKYSESFFRWMGWEVTGTRKQPPGWNGLETTKVPMSEIEILQIDGRDITPALRQLKTGESFLWPHDPRNKSPLVPFQNCEVYPPGSPVLMHYTASRSKVLEGTEYTLKIPTDNPTKDENNPSKADLRYLIARSLRRGEEIQKIDANLGEDPRLLVLYEIGAFVDRKTGNGITVRDVSGLNNGNFWLPSFSIGQIGKLIAPGLDRSQYQRFWINTFIKPSGRAKALLLIRYGLQMDTPHLQNSLTEYDQAMSPTGRFAFRDMSDTSLVRPIAEIIAPKELRQDRDGGFEPVEDLKPILGEISANKFFYTTSVGLLGSEILHGDNPPHIEYDDPVERVRAMHINAAKALEKYEIEEYINTIINELHLNGSFRTISSLQKFLFSPSGLAALKAYHHLP